MFASTTILKQIQFFGRYGVESAEIDVTLLMLERPKDEVLAEIRERVTLLPGMNVSIGQPISHRIDHMLSGTRANIAVKVFGDDLTMLRSLARQVETAMSVVPNSGFANAPRFP